MTSVPKRADNGLSCPQTPTVFPAVHIWHFVCVRMSAVDDAWRCRSLSHAAHGPCQAARIPACHSGVPPTLSLLALRTGSVRSSDRRIGTSGTVRWALLRMPLLCGEGTMRRAIPSDYPDAAFATSCATARPARSCATGTRTAHARQCDGRNSDVAQELT